MAKMSAEQKLEWYRKSIREGGSVRVGARIITREADLPSLGVLASTEEERTAALNDIDARRRALNEEESRLRATALASPTGDSQTSQTDADSPLTSTGEGRSGDKARANNKQQTDKDDLPKDFPGREALVKAGFTKRSQVKNLSEEELLGLTGDPETTRKILEAVR